jgi:hypothetical protein
MANNALLKQVLQRIEENQGMWDQTVWLKLNVNGFTGEDLKRMVLEDPQNPACGTAGCFAGTACLIEGWKPRFNTVMIEARMAFRVNGEVREGDNFTAEFVYKGGAAAGVSVSKKARELLDISDEDADILFNHANDLDTLRRYVEQLCENGEIGEPEPELEEFDIHITFEGSVTITRFGVDEDDAVDTITREDVINQITEDVSFAVDSWEVTG